MKFCKNGVEHDVRNGDEWGLRGGLFYRPPGSSFWHRVMTFDDERPSGFLTHIRTWERYRGRVNAPKAA